MVCFLFLFCQFPCPVNRINRNKCSINTEIIAPYVYDMREEILCIQFYSATLNFNNCWCHHGLTFTWTGSVAIISWSLPSLSTSLTRVKPKNFPDTLKEPLGEGESGPSFSRAVSGMRCGSISMWFKRSLFSSCNRIR